MAANGEKGANGSREGLLRRLQMIVALLAGVFAVAVPLGAAFWKAAGEKTELELRITRLEEQNKNDELRHEAVVDAISRSNKSLSDIEGQTKMIIKILEHGRRAFQ